MSTDPELHAYVDSLSRAAMAGLLLNLAGRNPTVAEALAAHRSASSGTAGKIVAGIRADLSASRRRSGPWPDFASIRKCMNQRHQSGDHANFPSPDERERIIERRSALS
ncbi:MAG: hypothetical protein HC822_15240 [Oscillochloris sp.]|nr:hypothetical protein [Oscillochloris sp.]